MSDAQNRAKLDALTQRPARLAQAQQQALNPIGDIGIQFRSPIVASIAAGGQSPLSQNTLDILQAQSLLAQAQARRLAAARSVPFGLGPVVAPFVDSLTNPETPDRLAALHDNILQDGRDVLNSGVDYLMGGHAATDAGAIGGDIGRGVGAIPDLVTHLPERTNDVLRGIGDWYNNSHITFPARAGGAQGVLHALINADDNGGGFALNGAIPEIGRTIDPLSPWVWENRAQNALEAERARISAESDNGHPVIVDTSARNAAADAQLLNAAFAAGSVAGAPIDAQIGRQFIRDAQARDLIDARRARDAAAIIAPDAAPVRALSGNVSVPIGSELDMSTGEVRPATPIDPLADMRDLGVNEGNAHELSGMFDANGNLVPSDQFLGRPLTPDHIWNDQRFAHRMAATSGMDGVLSPADRFNVSGEDIAARLANESRVADQANIKRPTLDQILSDPTLSEDYLRDYAPGRANQNAPLLSSLDIGRADIPARAGFDPLRGIGGGPNEDRYLFGRAENGSGGGAGGGNDGGSAFRVGDTVDAYHGTASNVGNFEGTAFFTRDPRVASDYAQSASPLRRDPRTGDFSGTDQSGPNVMPMRINTQGFAEIRGPSISQDPVEYHRAVDALNSRLQRMRRDGVPGVVVRGFADGADGVPRDQIAVFDQSRVQSRFASAPDTAPTVDISDPLVRARAENEAAHGRWLDARERGAPNEPQLRAELDHSRDALNAAMANARSAHNVGQSLGREVFDVPGQPEDQIIRNPTRADLARMTRTPAGGEAWRNSTIRYIRDEAGNIYVAPAANVLHKDMAAVLRDRGLLSRDLSDRLARPHPGDPNIGEATRGAPGFDELLAPKQLNSAGSALSPREQIARMGDAARATP